MKTLNPTFQNEIAPQSLAGILNSDQISDQDLLAHKYHYAKITCFQIDVTNLPTSRGRFATKIFRNLLGIFRQGY